MAEPLVWIDADSTSWPLHDESTGRVLLGVEGIHATDVDFVEDDVPLQAGSRLRSVRLRPREVFLPLRLSAATATLLRAEVRNWVYRLHPSRGDGTLRWTGPDGASRDLTCRYRDGFQGRIDGDSGGGGLLWQTFGISLHAFDPWLYDTSATTDTWTTGSTATFFPFFPLRLSSSEIFADETVDNSGDVEAWPTWTITGPGSDPILRNLTSGKLLNFTGATLAAGDTITVDTRPGVKTVTHSDGSNYFGELTVASALWPLVRGSNTVRAEMGASTAASSVVLSFKRRWLGV